MKLVAWVVLLGGSVLGADAPQKGVVLEDVRCLRDATQGYALYVPSNYSADREWPLLLAFDPRARGLNAVERFAEAAEKYGWIVAGSNNSRNGSWDLSLAALGAMSKDVLERFRVNEKRLYTAGMSGGARVAMQIGLSTGGNVAGVIAGSAGYPDSQPRKTVTFAVFGVAGTEDFNWYEMQEVDKALKTPHRLRIFEGGHVWMPKEVASEAVEWMELVAMRKKLRALDAKVVEALWNRREASAKGLTGKAAWEAWKALGEDFAGLYERASEAAEMAKKLEKDKSVKEGVKHEREEMELELQVRREISAAEAGLGEPTRRRDSLEQLSEKVGRLVRQGKQEKDSVERRVARRVTRGLSSAVSDTQYRKVLEEAGLQRGMGRQ